MDVVQLERRVETYFREHAGRYGLHGPDVHASYRLNPGGFVNASFRVSDGRVSLFLKLSGWSGADTVQAAAAPAVTAQPGTPAASVSSAGFSPTGDAAWPGDDTRAGLRQWHALADRLTSDYHAPRLVGRIQLEGGPEGLLFEWIDGDTPDRLSDPLSTEMFAMLDRLHTDEWLARRLPAGRTCADAYARSMHERFVDDLAHVTRHRPPFVDEARLGWLRAQAAELQMIVATSPAFRGPANAPVHGDLWLQNVLVSGSGQWYLLDWDNLRLGDPVADLATLLGPTRTVIDLTPAPLAVPTYMDDAALARFEVYRRAVVLDWIIDPLADWIEAAGVPAHTDAVRAEKQATHEAARALWQRMWG